MVENIQHKLVELRKSMPGYEFSIISNQGEFIGASIGEVKDSALLGIFLAVIVLYIFLRRMNTTLIVSVSIPISIIATFNLMYFNGLSMNIMTLGGLALVVTNHNVACCQFICNGNDVSASWIQNEFFPFIIPSNSSA